MKLILMSLASLLAFALGGCGGGGDNGPPPHPVAFDQDSTVGINDQLFDTLDADRVDYSTCTFSIVTSPQNGSITVNPDNGQFTYTPDNNFMGIDTFYWVVDDQWGDSNIAQYTIGVGEPASLQFPSHQDLARR